jgi:hypothetical protein
MNTQSNTKKKNKKSDKGYNILAGRPRKKPWEHKVTMVFTLQQETYQRIVRLAKREKRTKSDALELLIRTQEAEQIEPTLPVDYSHLMPQRGYAVSQILLTK